MGRVGDSLSFQATLPVFVDCSLALDTPGHRLLRRRPQFQEFVGVVVFFAGTVSKKTGIYTDFYETYAKKRMPSCFEPGSTGPAAKAAAKPVWSKA